MIFIWGVLFFFLIIAIPVFVVAFIWETFRLLYDIFNPPKLEEGNGWCIKLQQEIAEQKSQKN